MEKYIQYKAADFAEDADFVKWVQSDFTEQAKKWEVFTNDHPSLGDEISEAIDIIELFQFENKDIPANRKDDLLTRINSSIEKEATPSIEAPNKEAVKETVAKSVNTTVKETAPANSSKSIFKYLIPLAAAACLAALLIFNLGDGSISENSLVENETSISETTNFILPDQTKVQLNAASLLSFDKDNFTTERKLRLNGEAFFNVKKGQSFVIETINGNVEVLGTSFNVFSRGKFFEVECITGKVKVTNKSGSDSVILKPNEFCKLANKKLKQGAIDVRESNWTKGIYQFKETPLRLVIDELERQFNIDVTLPPGVRNKKYTGFFEKKTLDEALHAITYPLSLEFSVNPDLTNNKKTVVIQLAQ